MGDVRDLENRHFSEIIKHLKLAINGFTPFTCTRLSTEEEDTKLSFDLQFNMNLQISVRIRKKKYTNFKDLTIRYKSKGGNETEIDKINNYKAQIYFYAYLDEFELSFDEIYIVDVQAIRSLYAKQKFNGPYRNKDNSQLIAFNFEDIKNEGGELYHFTYEFN
jgi:hypothetical protein